MTIQSGIARSLAAREATQWIFAWRVLLLAIAGIWGGCASRPSEAGALRVYLNAFQSGEIVVFEPATERTLHRILVEDGAGSAAFQVSPDGKRLFVIDGARDQRLRVLDAESWKILKEVPLENRLMVRGGGAGATLSADGQWLFVDTYEQMSAARGIRIFSVENQGFLSIGLRERACAGPKLGTARTGAVLLACPGTLQDVTPRAELPIDFAVEAQVDTTITDPVDVVVSPDGKDAYVLGYSKEDPPPRLAQWTRGQEVVQERGLEQLIGERPAVERWGTHGFAMDLDGVRLAIVHGNRVWVLDRPSLALRRRIDLPFPVVGASFAGTEGQLIAVGTDQGDAVVMRVSPETAEVSTSRAHGVSKGARPIRFEVGTVR